ncbi:hypothetical protein [Paraclostridium bifermentans]|uniref:hypothetical protein n=1 Tax=Paraclostridium bifermentans TaxID=1490 RepID=UPI00290A43C4|nr:hypothetical protein [Paraclostridium bifermentans]MDU3802258.1 hypothetical protein [Paraclostridium bifermentans]
MSENKSNNVKIGARVLSEEALNKLLPTNNNIHSQIKKMREAAAENNNVKNKHEAMLCKVHNNIGKCRDREYDRHFNNTISLLGERGSGKTSAMLTIKHTIDIDNRYKGDIVMPIIVPEKMGDSSDVLGWTIGLFGNIIENIESDIYTNHESKFIEDNRFFRNCRKLEKSALSEKYKELLYYYTYTNNDYRKILLDNYEGLNSYINKSKNILSSEQELSIKFEKLIDEILDVKRKINKNIHSNLIEPLIFIFFDDVDLSTERCMDLLNVILRYLANSNIVTFVSGNYKTFLEVITINNLKKEGLLNKQKESCFYLEKNNNGITALESRKVLAIDILKKILPPALRYYFPQIKNKDKIGFTYSTEDDNQIEVNDSNKDISSKYETLKELIVRKLMDKDIEDSFMEYNGDDIEIYFSIFDDKPRGLMNVYYFLNTLDNYENKTNLNISEDLRSFINVVIHSSDVLAKYEDEIKQIIDIQEDLNNSFINYQYIEMMILESENINKNDIENILKVFLLANFIENIISLKVKNRNTHGKDTLIKILNFTKGFSKFKVYPNLDDIKLLLHMYSKMSGRISLNRLDDIEKLNVQSETMSIYLDILSNVSKNKNIYNLLKDTYKQDELWTTKIVEIILENSSSTKIILNKNKTKVKKDILKITQDYKDIEQINKEIENIDFNSENITYNLVLELNQIINRIQEPTFDEIVIKEEDSLEEHKTIMKINKVNTIFNIIDISDYISNKKILYKEVFRNLPKIYILNDSAQKMLRDADMLSKLIEEEEEAQYIDDISFNFELNEHEYNKVMRILKDIPTFRIRSLPNRYRDFMVNLMKSMRNLKISYDYNLYSYVYEEINGIDEIIDILKLDLVSNALMDIIKKCNEENKQDSHGYKFKKLREKLESNKNTSWFKAFVKSINIKLEKDSRYV